MCQKCNDALLATAQASDWLASAAQKLYNINQSAEAKILAEAAAELFKPVPEPKVSGETSTAGKGSPEAGAETPAVKFPDGLYVDEASGLVYIDGQLIGRAVLVAKANLH